MNRLYNLPIEIQKRILNFRLEKELNDKIKERLENNIKDYKSGKKNLFYEIIEREETFILNKHERNRQTDLLIKELENGNTKMFWESILLMIEYKLLSNNRIIGLRYYDNNELMKMIYDNELVYPYGLIYDQYELIHVLLSI